MLAVDVEACLRKGVEQVTQGRFTPLDATEKEKRLEGLRRKLERALRYYEARDVLLVIRDLAHGPKTEEEQAIMSVPTLLMKHPRLTFISGELSGGKGVLDELLRSAGVRRRAPR